VRLAHRSFLSFYSFWQVVTTHTIHLYWEETKIKEKLEDVGILPYLNSFGIFNNYLQIRTEAGIVVIHWVRRGQW
jgi:hypothetical protein